MSVGPGKIRVFRADDKGAKKEESAPRRQSVSPKPKQAPKAEARVIGMDGKTSEKRVAANGRTVSSSNSKGPRQPISAGQGKFALPLDKRPEPLEAIRVKHRLVLNDKQRARLEALFSAPNALASLLRAYPQRLVTPSDASVFLLSNRKELDTYINPDARGRAVDLLTELLLQWSGSPPDSIGIDFDDVSLTPDQRVYLPLEGYRGVEVAEPMQLLGQRKGRLFRAPFTLFEEGKHFFVAFTLEPKLAIKQPVQTIKQKVRDNRPREIQLKPGQPLPYISGMRHQPGEPRQRVLYSKYSGVFSGGLKTMNWGSLSGWGVNGGLPSLGKRSR